MLFSKKKKKKKMFFFDVFELLNISENGNMVSKYEIRTLGMRSKTHTATLRLPDS